MTIWVDRSGIETYEKCPRKWYYQRAHLGTGLERADLQLAAEVGTAVHEGIEYLLKGSPVEVAVTAARGKLIMAYGEDPIDPALSVPQKLYDREEGLAMAEALVRAWALARLSRVLEFGEVVAIEKEMTVKFTVGDETVGLQCRPDIVQRRRGDGALFIRNIKTVAEANRTWQEQWKLDMQTLSECLAVEAELGEKVSGVIIEGCVKGRRLEYPLGSGQYYHNSPLTQGWYKAGEPPMVEEDWQSRYEWKDSDGASHRLPRGYRKRPVWKEFPGRVAAWVEGLWSADRAVVEAQFITLDPILRSEYEVERWKRQVLERAVATHKGGEWMELCRTRAGLPGYFDQELDRNFPMHTASGNCLRPGRCTFYELCHGTGGDPMEYGYRARRPHHAIPTEE